MNKKWQTLNRLVEINNSWLTLIGEKLKDDKGNILDYWRVEKEDSVIIITIYRHQLLFPISVFRPGVGKLTLDFAGGRIKKRQTPQQATLLILEKELGIKDSDLDTLIPINNIGWEINSSFSNQKLYGFLAEIKPRITINSNFIGSLYSLNQEGIDNLLKDLTCLQCRGLFLEFLNNHQALG